MKVFVVSLLFVLFSLLPACENGQESVATESQTAVISVYKTPTCGCCKKWVNHLREKGFTVETHDQPSLTALKQEQGVPKGAEACHTALVDGYVI